MRSRSRTPYQFPLSTTVHRSYLQSGAAYAAINLFKGYVMIPNNKTDVDGRVALHVVDALLASLMPSMGGDFIGQVLREAERRINEGNRLYKADAINLLKQLTY